MGEGTANAATIQVDDVILLAAGENHAVAKSIEALRTHQARFEQPFQGIAEGLQVRAQVAATGIANTEFLDESGIVHSALREILNAFRITVEFQLIEGGRVREQLGSGGEFFLEINNALAKREMARQFDKANQVATTPNAVTSQVHDQMPVILSKDDYELWLDPGMTNIEVIADLLKPFDSRLMRAYPVSGRVNQVQNDDEGCSKPVTLDQLPQGSLFA